MLTVLVVLTQAGSPPPEIDAELLPPELPSAELATVIGIVTVNVLPGEVAEIVAPVILHAVPREEEPDPLHPLKVPLDVVNGPDSVMPVGKVSSSLMFPELALPPLFVIVS